jgi:hypothetical protein
VLTRPIWNQYSYHVSNVTSDGRTPAVEDDNWTVPGLNNYRQNVQGRGIWNAPNLSVTLEATESCYEAAVRLSAVIVNEGSRGVPAGIPIEFRRLTPEPAEVVATSATTTALLPGASERITITVTEFPNDETHTFEAVIDPAPDDELGAVEECDEDDNAGTADAYCSPIG